MPLTSNKEKFTKKSVNIHGDKYDYSLVNYINWNSKVEIICKYHGIFLQIPHSHLQGSGCPSCASVKKLNTSDYIEKAKLIHNNKYDDYSLVNYVKRIIKIEIICKYHGIFSQNPNNHLNGNGCPSCGGSKKLNTIEFIKRANLIHNNEYDYSLVDYKNWKTKIEIICKKHNIFNQTPHNHLQREGCPKCNSSKGEIKIENYLIEKKINYKPQYTFSDLKYKRKLLFDFGILDKNNNLRYLIEFNGEQHYVFSKIFHKTNEKFEETKYKDILKIDYCFKNKIPLIIIKYNEDINEELSKLIHF